MSQSHNSRRRPYRQENEIDDAWAAASDDALGDPSADVGDLAAGYVWEDEARFRVRRRDEDRANLGPLPAYQRRSRGRNHMRSYAQPIPEKPKRGTRRDFHVPFWGILMLVILGMAALIVAALAFASVFTLLFG